MLASPLSTEPPRLAAPDVVTAAVVLLSCLAIAAASAADAATAAAAMKGGVIRRSTAAGSPMPRPPIIAAASSVDGRDAEGKNPMSLNLPCEAACIRDVQDIKGSKLLLTRLLLLLQLNPDV